MASSATLHCWRTEDEDHEYLSDEYVQRAAFGPSWGICLLERGHDGAHDYYIEQQAEEE